MYLFICYHVQRNVGFQSILSDQLPLRVGVKPGNSVLISFIALEYFKSIITGFGPRGEEDKIVLPSPYAMGCIWIIFAPNKILIT